MSIYLLPLNEKLIDLLKLGLEIISCFLKQKVTSVSFPCASSSSVSGIFLRLNMSSVDNFTQF